MVTPIFGNRSLKIVDENNENIVVVADTHIGFEQELKEKGLRLPFQTRRLAKQLTDIGRREKADKLIILGDLKHGILGIGREELNEVSLFLEELSKTYPQIEVIIGNHDGGLIGTLEEDNIKFHSSRGILVRESSGRVIGLFHGHAWPSPELFKAQLLVMGHIHPSIEVADEMGFRIVEPVWLHIPLDKKMVLQKFLRYHLKKPIYGSETDILHVFTDVFGFTPRFHLLVVMPAFNHFLKGLAVNKYSIGESISPILNAIGAGVLRAEVFLLDGVFLGQLKMLTTEEITVLEGIEP